MAIAFPPADDRVLSRRAEILEGLGRLVAPEALITAEDERRAFETDALTAYRRLPLAVVLPSTTEEVSAVLRFCSAEGVKVVPRGAGTSLAGGAIPQEDAIVLGVSKMNRLLHADFANRTARVQPASPTSRSPRRSPTRASSTPQTRRASSPARSPATSP
jgi:glycolate oxidase